MLNNLIKEQNDIILSFKSGCNLKIDYVTESRKMPILLDLILINEHKTKSLIITNSIMSQLNIQTMINDYSLNEWCEVYTYYSYASKIYNKIVYNDLILYKCLLEEPENNPQIPILILDNVQDISHLYHKLTSKIIYDKQTIILIGDSRQCINDNVIFDSKYFNTGRLWKELTLSK